MHHAILNSLLLATFLCGYSALSSATPKDDFESEAILRDATNEIVAATSDQLDSIIEFIASCNPTPSRERNYSCERATKVIEIKCAEMNALSALVFALTLVDGTIQWTKAGATETEIRTVERRVNAYRTFTMAASLRYSHGLIPSQN